MEAPIFLIFTGAVFGYCVGWIVGNRDRKRPLVDEREVMDIDPEAGKRLGIDVATLH